MADKFLRCEVVGSIANSITVKPYVDGAEPITVYQQDNILIDPDTLRAEGGELGHMIEGESRVKAFKDMQAIINARSGPVAADIVYIGLLEQIAGSLAVIADVLAKDKDGEANVED